MGESTPPSLPVTSRGTGRVDSRFSVSPHHYVIDPGLPETTARSYESPNLSSHSKSERKRERERERERGAGRFQA